MQREAQAIFEAGSDAVVEFRGVREFGTRVTAGR